jgi:signal transduction histidine kinase
MKHAFNRLWSPFRVIDENLTVFQKGLILVWTPLAFHLVFFGLVAVIEGKNAQVQELAAQSQRVLTQAHEMLATAVDAETGIRGWTATGDAAFAVPFERAARELPGKVALLQALVQNDPGQQPPADRIGTGAAAVLAWHRKSAALLRAGDRAAAVSRLKTQEDKRRMDDLRREVAAFLAEEERLGEARARELRQARDTLGGLFVLGGVTAFLVTGLIAYFFSRGIGQRLRAVSENARRLGGSEPLGRPLAGTDEMAHLDHAIHKLADVLATAARREREDRANLERRVLERTADLTRSNRELAQRNRENETFVYSVSHDLRSPLVNLLGFSKELSVTGQELRALLADDRLPADVRQRGHDLIDGGMAESIQFIQTAVARLSGIIDALLRLSRAGRVQYQWRAVEMNSVLARVVEALRGTMAERGAAVTVNEIPEVWGDATALEQVFANLIGNALNYLDPARPGVIEVGVVPGSADEVIYYIKDNGRGIPEAGRDKVFRAFQRLHPDAPKGEGMGLTIVSRVVERHGGRVWFESAVGQGTTFYVSLPVREGPVSGVSLK